MAASENMNSMALTLVQSMQFKGNLSSCTKLASKLKFRYFINAIAASLFVRHLSSPCNPAFYFNTGKKLRTQYHFPPHVSIITGNILITIITFACYYLLPGCFQQHFLDWFSALRYNSDLNTPIM